MIQPGRVYKGGKLGRRRRVLQVSYRKNEVLFQELDTYHRRNIPLTMALSNFQNWIKVYQEQEKENTMGPSMCPDQLSEDHQDDDIPTFDGSPHVPSLRDVLTRINLLEARPYLKEADSIASQGRVLYGAVCWYEGEGQYVYAGLSDGVVRFSVDRQGHVESWIPEPVSSSEVERIIRRCNTKIDTFNQMLRDRTVIS